MLIWTQPQSIEGVTVYGDDKSPSLFYVFPSQPRFRIDDNGKPVFKFLKYRMPIDRGNGKKGGGFIIFDVEFSVPDDVMNKVKATLQGQLNTRFANMNPKPQVQIGEINATKGEAHLQILDSGGGLVQKIQNPGSPSLYGKMITPFTVELSPEGATLAEQALQDQGGVVQVSYSITVPVKLPPVTARVWFYADKMMSFKQQVDIDWSFWGDDSYRETIKEKWSQSETSRIEIDPGGVTDPKVISAVRDWAQQSLDDAVKRMVLGDIAPVSADDRKVPDGIEHAWKDISVEKVASFSRTYSEGAIMEWDPHPQGTLPNITSMVGRDGKPFKWADYARTVDLDDPFFKELNINIMSNADFVNLPLFSVEVHVDYNQGSTHSVGDFRFTKSDDVGNFASYIENNIWKYKYHYKVNFKNQTKTFTSPDVEVDDKVLTINVDDAGFLIIDTYVGDVNFDQVSQAQVTIHYEDPQQGVAAFEEEFTLDKAHTLHRTQQLIFAPRTKPYTYQVKYFMKDGKEFAVSPQQGLARQLYINDPFSANKTVSVRAIGDLQNDISTIFIDLSYADDKNQYSQTATYKLDKGNTFTDWNFPVIDENSGIVTYSGSIQFQDGSVEEIKSTQATRSTIMVGRARDDAEFLSIAVMPDLIDFTKVKLAKVSLHYADPANSIDSRTDIVLKAGAPAPAAWKVRLQDKTKRTYEWQATFYMIDGSNKVIPLTQATDSALIPEVPN